MQESDRLAPRWDAMPLVSWDEAKQTGIPSIDAQHKRLFALVNELDTAICLQSGSAVVPRLLGDLLAYTREHFAHEEQLMSTYGFPGYEKHKGEHDRFVARVEQLRAELPGRDPASPERVMGTLEEWLRYHMLETDRGYVDFLIARLPGSEAGKR